METCVETGQRSRRRRIRDRLPLATHSFQAAMATVLSSQCTVCPISQWWRAQGHSVVSRIMDLGGSVLRCLGQARFTEHHFLKFLQGMARSYVLMYCFTALQESIHCNSNFQRHDSCRIVSDNSNLSSPKYAGTLAQYKGKSLYSKKCIAPAHLSIVLSLETSETVLSFSTLRADMLLGLLKIAGAKAVQRLRLFYPLFVSDCLYFTLDYKSWNMF